MPTTLQRYCLATLCLLSLAAPRLQAQSRETPPSSSAEEQKPASKDVLAHDARLKVKVSLRRKLTTLPEALDTLSAMTKIKMKVEDKELETSPLGLSFQSAPLRTILREIAALYNAQWQRDPDNYLTLRPLPEYDFLRPKNETQAEIYRKGREFMSQFARLSETFQNDMQNRHDPNFYAPEGVAFSDCPPAMQGLLGEMLAASLQDQQAAGMPSDFPQDKLNDTRVRLDVTPQNGATEYLIMLAAPRQGACISFTIFHDAREDYHVVPLATFSADIARLVTANARSQQQALQREPRLKNRLSLKLQNVTIAQALQILAVKAGLDMLAKRPDLAATKSLTLVNVSLKEALDRLCAQYEFRALHTDIRYQCTWGWQESGVFTFLFMPVIEAGAQ